MPTDLLTLDETATELKLHSNTVYRYIEQGELKAIRLDGVFRIRRNDLDEFLKSRETIGKGV